MENRCQPPFFFLSSIHPLIIYSSTNVPDCEVLVKPKIIKFHAAKFAFWFWPWWWCCRLSIILLLGEMLKWKNPKSLWSCSSVPYGFGIFVCWGVVLDSWLSSNDCTKHPIMTPPHETYIWWSHFCQVLLEMDIEKRRWPRLKQSFCDHFLSNLFPTWSFCTFFQIAFGIS